jgi:hypothetical protein
MENKGLIDFKEVLRQGMIQNFEKCGYIVPVVFFYMENNPVISMIPSEILSTNKGKDFLAGMIRNFCQANPVLAAGIIIEANAAKISPENNDVVKKVADGDIRVADLEEKQDIIMLVFSTPEKEEMISYVVDCENKKVLEPFGDVDGYSGVSGRFSHLFSWRKN